MARATHGGRIDLQIRCASVLAAPCRGRVELRTVTAAGPPIAGAATLDVRNGRATVSIQLDRVTRRTLRRGHRLVITAFFTHHGRDAGSGSLLVRPPR